MRQVPSVPPPGRVRWVSGGQGLGGACLETEPRPGLVPGRGADRVAGLGPGFTGLRPASWPGGQRQCRWWPGLPRARAARAPWCPVLVAGPAQISLKRRDPASAAGGRSFPAGPVRGTGRSAADDRESGGPRTRAARPSPKSRAPGAWPATGAGLVSATRDAIAAPALGPAAQHRPPRPDWPPCSATVSAPGGGPSSRRSPNVLVIRGPADTSLAGPADPAATVLAQHHPWTATRSWRGEPVHPRDQEARSSRWRGGRFRTGQGAMTLRQADRVYLGWEYAVLHPPPGPRRPRRPVTPRPGAAGSWLGWRPSSGRKRRLSLPLEGPGAGGQRRAGRAERGPWAPPSVLTPALDHDRGWFACLGRDGVVWCTRASGRGARETPRPGGGRGSAGGPGPGLRRGNAGWPAWQGGRHAQRFSVDWEARRPGSSRPSGSGTGVTLPHRESTGFERSPGGTLAGWSALMAPGWPALRTGRGRAGHRAGPCPRGAVWRRTCWPWAADGRGGSTGLGPARGPATAGPRDRA